MNVFCFAHTKHKSFEYFWNILQFPVLTDITKI